MCSMEGVLCVTEGGGGQYTRADAAYPATRICALADHRVRLRKPAQSC
jgi:hypothetical protein